MRFRFAGIAALAAAIILTLLVSLVAIEDARASTHEERLVLHEVNSMRQANGLSRLHLNRKLRRAARVHNADMASHSYFAHEGTDGSTPADRARAVGFMPRIGVWKVGEVLYTGTGPLASPQAAMDGWMHSPPHRAILTDPDYRVIGVHIVNGGVLPGGLTYTADLGVR